MEKIELDCGVEEPVLSTILTTPNRIVFVPKNMYEKFKKYLIQEERYEDIAKLELIKNKVTSYDYESDEGEELFVGISQKICDN